MARITEDAALGLYAAALAADWCLDEIVNRVGGLLERNGIDTLPTRRILQIAIDHAKKVDDA